MISVWAKNLFLDMTTYQVQLWVPTGIEASKQTKIWSRHKPKQQRRSISLSPLRIWHCPDVVLYFAVVNNHHPN
jgi:hypothetical protein